MTSILILGVILLYGKYILLGGLIFAFIYGLFI